jgi:Ran GTPase-activating protein (RanGAP) involved in mRNA processing and transport
VVGRAELDFYDSDEDEVLELEPVRGEIDADALQSFARDPLQSSPLVQVRSAKLYYALLGDVGVTNTSYLFSSRLMPRLTNVDLSFNSISDAGAAELSKHLDSHPALYSLNLAGNALSDKGCADLARVLSSAPSLETVNLAFNNITAAGADVLLSSLALNKRLTSLVLRGNPLSADSVRGGAVLGRLQAALAENRRARRVETNWMAAATLIGCSRAHKGSGLADATLALLPLILSYARPNPNDVYFDVADG